jgi:hypothetical protein
MELLAWPTDDPDDIDAPPALRVGVALGDLTDPPGRQEDLAYSLHGELAPGTERLLVSVTLASGRTDFDWADEPRGARPSVVVRSSSESAEWQPVSSATVGLGHEREIISNEEFQLNYHIDIAVYRAEPSPETTLRIRLEESFRVQRRDS